MGEECKECPVCWEHDRPGLIFPYCKHVICMPCAVNIMYHTPGQTNIRCPLCRKTMFHGLRLDEEAMGRRTK